ncbi:YkyA family protein [Sporosarcina sp. FSL K6-1522]|uniref:YkyA family protein n=1 Tax=Sporosarcina sp. FSL K6-1522 TaxID=2921554 RepID=UPI00315AC87A
MKKFMMACICGGMVLLSGCSSEASIEQELADVLSEIEKAEKDYRTAQANLTKLERSEQQQFNALMELTQDEMEQVEKKVGKLEKFLQERLGDLEQEELAMRKASESASDLDAIIEKVPEDDKKRVEEMKKTLMSRYELHTFIVEEYTELATIQQNFYEQVSTEGITLSELRDLVDEVNVQNKIVQEVISAFNDETDRVNGLKDALFTAE